MTKKLFIPAAAMALLLAACGGSKSGGSGDRSTPKGTAEIIFSAAKSGDFSALKDIASEGADSDSKHVADVATSTDNDLKESFKKYFSKGTVNGEPKVDGDKAEVPIKFGPDGTKEETFKMVKKDGKWYLESF